MNAVRRIAGFLADSPTYGRDRANLISGFSIGTAGLLLNFAVLLFVAPLMFDPDDADFSAITENLEFGQLLALILLGGATAFATLLIPFRLLTVFWGPRIGRYFDQVVLSGISPLRFVIGKAASQNLFFGLILFLLLPYFVLSLTLGGVDAPTFLSGMFVVWLYCIALALVTLWVSLYLNELLAALVVIFIAANLCAYGCFPFFRQPFVMTPFPVLLQPVYATMPSLVGQVDTDYWPVFLKCTGCLTAVIGVSLLAIHLGPLYGIVRENSTFGEVVRQGDSQRKRWFRLRLHIQRPSELAFFYENRGPAFASCEGLVRWGLGLAALVLPSSVAYFTFLYFARMAGSGNWFAYVFHAYNLVIVGFVLVSSVLLFSHARNTTFVKVPVLFGSRAQVSQLDTAAFVLCLLLGVGTGMAVPNVFQHFWGTGLGIDVFTSAASPYQRPVDFVRLAIEAPLAFGTAALVIYAWQRLLCLIFWMKSVAFSIVAVLYFFGVCILPLFIGVLFLEATDFRDSPFVREWAPLVAMVSPIVFVMYQFNEMGSQFPRDVSTMPFYLVHYILLAVALVGIQRRSARLRAMSLTGPVQEAG